MISLKKYLDMEANQSPDEPDSSELAAAALAAYRCALLSIGKSGAKACPAVGSDLQQQLTGLENRLARGLTVSLLRETQEEVEAQLLQWGSDTAEHFKTKANEVRELLIVLARTAESLGERDQRYARQFTQFTARLQTIADLEDLTQVRASLVQGATELKTYVDQMERESLRSVAQLHAEVSAYEGKLKAAEELALRDPLTGLANRRNVEIRIEWRIAHQQAFCVAMLDLNHFKQVNDRYGHAAGDNLLKQFSQELTANLRSTDLVGRWSGDEFVVVLDCDLSSGKSQIERMRQWVFGEYTIQLGATAGEAKINVDAAIGVAQWQRGESAQDVIERADAAMYREKKLARRPLTASARRS